MLTVTHLCYFATVVTIGILLGVVLTCFGRSGRRRKNVRPCSGDRHRIYNGSREAITTCSRKSSRPSR